LRRHIRQQAGKLLTSDPAEQVGRSSEVTN
jgi:hypothetical protein